MRPVRLRSLNEAECYARCYGDGRRECALREARAPAAALRPRHLRRGSPARFRGEAGQARAAARPSRRARGRRPQTGRGRVSHRHPKEGSPGLLPAAILVGKCAHVGHKRAPRKRPGRAPFQTSSGRGSTCSSAGSIRAASPTRRRLTSRTRATTSGGFSTTRGSRRGCSSRPSSSSFFASASASRTPRAARRRGPATCGVPTSPVRQTGSSASRASSARGSSGSSARRPIAARSESGRRSGSRVAG